MNEERKYSNNNIFANNGVNANNQNNITPNNEPNQASTSINNLSTNQSIQGNTNNLSSQNLASGINQNTTNNLNVNANSNINTTANNQRLSSQALNSQPDNNLPPIPPTNNPNNSSFEPEKKKKKNNILPIAIIAIVLIAIGGLIAYKTLPMFQNKFKVMINETFKYLSSNIKEAENTTGSMTLQIKSNSSEPELKNLEKLKLSADYAVDIKNKQMNIDIKSSYDNEPLLNASLYSKSPSMYISLEDLYSKIIEIPLGEEYDQIFNQENNQKEEKQILKSINKALDSSLKESYFTKAKDTVNNEKVDATTLTLNNDNYKKIKEDFINTLLKDKAFLKNSAKLSDKEVSDIETTLKETLDEEEALLTEIKLTVYTKGTNLRKIEIISEDTNISIISNKDQYDYTVKVGEDSITGVLKTTTTKTETTANLTMTYEDVTFEINTTSKKGAGIKAKDTSNSINYEELTEEDTQEIALNLLQSKGLLKFLEDLGLGSSTYDDTDDWSLDDEL